MYQLHACFTTGHTPTSTYVLSMECVLVEMLGVCEHRHISCYPLVTHLFIEDIQVLQEEEGVDTIKSQDSQAKPVTKKQVCMCLCLRRLKLLYGRDTDI